MIRIVTLIMGLLLLLGCSNENLAGGSSGVDNPGITLSLVDASGTPITVSGQMSIYSRDHNPVLNPNPISSDSFRNENLVVIDTFHVPSNVSDTLELNILIQTQNNLTRLKSGLSYSRNSFFLDGTPVTQKDTLNISLIPPGTYCALPTADIKNQDWFDSSGRIDNSRCIDSLGVMTCDIKYEFAPINGLVSVYIPGTPFIATAETGYIFSNLPPGTYNVVYADSMGTRIHSGTIEVFP